MAKVQMIFGMALESRKVQSYRGRPAVVINGDIYVGRARKSALKPGDDAEVIYRERKVGKSITCRVGDVQERFFTCKYLDKPVASAEQDDAVVDEQ